MDKTANKIEKDYKKNIEIKDVEFYKCKIWWDNLIVKIVDNNKKHFKNQTLRNKFFYKDGDELKYYVDQLIDNYIDDMIGDKIRKLESYEIVEKCKKELFEKEK